MKNKRNVLYSLVIMLTGVIGFSVQCQQKKGVEAVAGIKDTIITHAPNSIVRTIKQDAKGNIWIASWEGVFKYNGKSFTNVTSNVSSARFFSVLQDSKGNFWFASVGSGVYYYDGKTFKNYTTKDGLANDRVTNIYEDKNGIIWFGTEGGASSYDGKSFRNFKMNEARPPAASDSVHSSAYQHPLPENSWMHNDVNAIIEDKTGKFWFATRGNTFTYDGNKFTPVTNNDGKPFTNVRCIIKDKNGDLWLGGADGLWRYDGTTFTNFNQKFVGYIYEDKNGNIWTSSETDNKQVWELSRYDTNSLNNEKPIPTVIANKPMIFGILEDGKGNIWFGDFDGVHRYDGKTITDFNQ